MKEINKESKVPLYAQLMEVLIEKIEKYMNDDDKLESEREICKTYALSRTTVRQALDELERQKYIYKIHGKGNFIASRTMEQSLIKLYSFTDEMKKLGKKPTTQIVGFEITIPNEAIIKKLKLDKNNCVYKITRLRLSDNIPMIYEITYLPYDRFVGLSKEIMEEAPMYSIFKTNYNVKIKYAEEYLKAVSANKLEGIYLEIEENKPCLKIERIASDYERVVEYTVSIARGDKFKYKVHLDNE